MMRNKVRGTVRQPSARQATQGFGAWVRLLPQAALMCFGIAAFRFVEVLVKPPPLGGASRPAVALLAGSVYWLAGLLTVVLALIAWAIRRALGLKAPPASSTPPVQWTAEARLRGRGFSIVAGWVGLSLVAAIIMADTRTGPAARFATGVLGLDGLAGVATFLLGLPVLLSPLLLLALLPWQARWPLVAGMQAAVKSPPAPVRRRRRR